MNAVLSSTAKSASWWRAVSFITFGWKGHVNCNVADRNGPIRGGEMALVLTMQAPQPEGWFLEPMLKAQVQWYMLRITTLGRQRQGWGGGWILKTHWSANIDKLVNSGLSERLSKQKKNKMQEDTHWPLVSLSSHPHKSLYMHADTQKENLWAFLTLLMCTGKQGFLLQTPWEFQNYSQ